MNIDKKKTGTRLKNFLYEHFDSIDAAAKSLGTTVASLRNSYFNGKSLPGAEIILKLQQLGCDTKWLLEGKKDIKVHDGFSSLEYRVIGMVPAGKGESVDWSDWWESEVLSYHPDDHVFIKIDPEFGYSMMPMIQPGDFVLISFSAKPQNGDLVAALWDKTKGALKVYNENPSVPNAVILTSYNQAVEPIFVKKDQVRMYKVVLIKKAK